MVTVMDAPACSGTGDPCRDEDLLEGCIAGHAASVTETNRLLGS